MPFREYSFNIAAADNGDWPKSTFDFPPEIASAVEFTVYLRAMGETVDHFKTLPAYYAALQDDEPAWLKDL